MAGGGWLAGWVRSCFVSHLSLGGERVRAGLAVGRNGCVAPGTPFNLLAWASSPGYFADFRGDVCKALECYTCAESSVSSLDPAIIVKPIQHVVGKCL